MKPMMINVTPLHHNTVDVGGPNLKSGEKLKGLNGVIRFTCMYISRSCCLLLKKTSYFRSHSQYSVFRFYGTVFAVRCLP